MNMNNRANSTVYNYCTLPETTPYCSSDLMKPGTKPEREPPKYNMNYIITPYVGFIDLGPPL